MLVWFSCAPGVSDVVLPQSNTLKVDLEGKRTTAASSQTFVVMLQKEEAELEKLREKERIRAGKELLEAKRKEDDLKLKRNLEMRRIEKAEEQRARDKIRVKLGQYSATHQFRSRLATKLGLESLCVSPPCGM